METPKKPDGEDSALAEDAAVRAAEAFDPSEEPVADLAPGEGGDSSAIATEERDLVSKIDKAVQKGAMHKNTGARKKSRAARVVASPAAK